MQLGYYRIKNTWSMGTDCIIGPNPWSFLPYSFAVSHTEGLLQISLVLDFGLSQSTCTETKEQGTFAGIPDLHKVKQFNFLTVLSCLCYYHVKSLSWASTATELHGNKPPELCQIASALVHPQWYWSPQSLLMSPGPKGWWEWSWEPRKQMGYEFHTLKFFYKEFYRRSM